MSTSSNTAGSATISNGDGKSHGREARQPEQIPKAGWRDIVSRVWKGLARDNVSLVAAGLAMFAMLSVFPSLAALVSIYGIFSSPDDVIKDMKLFVGILPPGTWDIFATQLKDIASHAGGTLTATAAVALLVSFWSARSGMASLMTATNIAYSEREKRGFVRQVLVSLAFTGGAILGFLIMLLLGIALPIALKTLGVSAGAEMVVDVLRWVLLWLVAVAGLAVIYRYAPARARAKWRWVTWGSVVAATLWVVGSVLFAVYVRMFAAYGKTYGAMGGVIALQMWFYLSSFTVLLGAEINAEMERQTRCDTTEGAEKPLGQRGAYAADTVGESATSKSRR
jgi:membrane protein